MLDTFFYAFNAIAPMLFLMLLGYYLRYTHFFDLSLLKRMSTFTFRFGISAMMFRNVYTLSDLSEIRVDMMCFILICCVAITAVGWAEAMLFTQQRSRRGVMIQNSFRSNFSIIGILLATALGGAEGGSIAASMQAPTIIYFNVVSVLCLIYFSDQPQRRVSPGYILKSIATNPMILGQVVGLACLIARQWIPRDASGELLFSIQGSLPFLYSAVDSLASMATPLILVLMGGQVDFSAVGAMKKELIVGIVQRLILAPVIGFCLAFGRPGSGRVYPHPRNCGYSGRGVWFTGCLSQRGHGGGDGRRRRAGPAVCCLDMRPEYADAAAVDCFSSGICFAVTEKYGEKYRDYRTSGRKSSISCEIVAPSAMRSVISQVHVLGNDGISMSSCACGRRNSARHPLRGSFSTG